MKTIDKLTEQEILALQDEDVEQLIKFKLATDGIKLMDAPVIPELHEIPPKDKVIYKCALFGAYIVFEDVEELRVLIKQIQESKTVCSISSDYQSTNDTNHITAKLKNAGYSSDDWDTIQTLKVYSNKLYDEVHSFIKLNEEYEKSYKKELALFDNAQEDSKEIKNGIWERVQVVRDKYYNLNLHVERFKHDYMPLANSDEAVAMNFLVKAYALTNDEQAYVLDHYKSK